MLSRVAIVTVALTGALVTAGVAGADPGDAALCNYTLSDPHAP